MLGATSLAQLPKAEDYSVFLGPTYGTVYRGVTQAPTVVPEPGALGLFGLAMAALGWARRRV